jgi:hypothetical protein
MRLAFVPLLLVAAAPAPISAAAPDRVGWIADFETAKAAITRTSPNLEWQAARGLDLAALEARTRARLAAATTPEAARDAIRLFLKPFADGHMEATPLAPPQSLAASPPKPTLVDCAALGIDDRLDEGGIATRLPGYHSLTPAGAAIPAGLIAVGHRRLGILRIALFAPAISHCQKALAASPPPATCDDKCRDRLSARIDDIFLTEIADRLRALGAARPDALLVDLADNGGGNDTAIAIARMLGGADVPSPRLALARTPAAVHDLENDLAELDRNISTSADRIRAAPYRARLAAALAQARQPCDLTPLWKGHTIACTNLADRGYAGGLAALEVPVADRASHWAALVSATALYHTATRLWISPVLILLDGNSASSTELLAAMLQDAHRAKIVGAPSFGAGCGHTRPAEPVNLVHLGLTLTIPDCARLRADGTNELDGIAPDEPIPFREYDTAKQRTQRLLDALPRLLDKAV